VLSFEWNDKNSLDFYKLILLSYSTEETIETLNEYLNFKIDFNKFNDEFKGVKSFIDNKKIVRIKNG